ncbi:hypothetical protein SADUNF_Sadunf02G0116100 [Salix dunnii]|uniref:Mago nashi-like protein n=1 Tax=Salix dunnii TaxID=1413687 RepID=A0A835THM8_9ROSI|nr:hypothetical protein SADUNF_Sadunf02G0116100 [Salix dunnii]
MAATEEDNGEFYLRYYVGHRGKFGHEFLEFEFRPDGKLRYANNSNYKNDTMIRKEVFLTPSVQKECRRIITESEIMKEDDNNWPEPNRVGRQELEIVMGNEHISFTTSKIGSLVDVHSSQDPEGLRIFYYLVQFYRKLSKVLSMLGLMNISWAGMLVREISCTPHHRVPEEKKRIQLLFKVLKYCMCCFIPPIFHPTVSNILSKPTMAAIGTTKGT